jgi:metal-responsive CopG/Arc/MetJ family transcriptional regulator
MAIREITMRLPEELLQSFDEVIERQSLTRDEALIRLVEDYVQRRGLAREIAMATLARLGREMPTNRSIDNIEIDANKVAKAIAETFGTDDPLEIVNMVRNRI